jgi:putative transposase
MKVLKMRFAIRLHHIDHHATASVWQKRFYDFNVCTDKKRVEKLTYMHRNPVKRGLVAEPDQWIWSSFRSYLYGEPGRVRINVEPDDVALTAS